LEVWLRGKYKAGEEWVNIDVKESKGGKWYAVWAHGNGSAAGKGIGMKSNDLLGAYACHACHDIVDRRRPTPVGMTRTEVELCFWEGHARSLIRLIDKGLIVLKRGRMEAHSMKTLQPTLPLTAAASTEKYPCRNLKCPIRSSLQRR
jgi:hypothetical protein